MEWHIVLVPFTPLQPENIRRWTPLLTRHVPLAERNWAVTDPILAPEPAYTIRRRQWHAPWLIDIVSRPPFSAGEFRIGIHPGDLYIPGFNFVFGLAEPSRRTAVIGLSRLRSPDPAITQHRIITEILHELGHLLGLQHCREPRCTMYFSNTVEDTDRKGPGFCQRCRHRLGHRLQMDTTRARTR